MKNRINEIIDIAKANIKVIENYFFMTILLLLNSFFIIIIYPYLINTLGKEAFGIYVFGSSVANYFINFVSFGFDLYGARKISENHNNLSHKSTIISTIFFIKLILELLSIITFIIIVLNFPVLRENIIVCSFCFLVTFSNILFPTWYFQGVQRMRIVSYIQLITKLLSLPFIFIMVRNSNDIEIFSIIMALSSLLGAVLGFLYLIKIEKIKIAPVPFDMIRKYIKESSYFFYTNIANTSKTEVIKIYIGIKYSMGDLAIFDLAHRIVGILLAVLSNVNSAFFPKIVNKFNVKLLKKIIVFEVFLGILGILGVVLFGKWAVHLLGEPGMESAYYMAVILSATVFIFLQTGCYIYLILIPKGYDKPVLYNQIIAFFSILLYLVIGISCFKTIYVLPVALVLSGITEIAYLRYLINKKKLLEI